jgi:hypothetical protein
MLQGSIFQCSACARRLARRTVTLGFIGAAAARPAISLLALRVPAVARGLAPLRAAGGGGFRAISGAGAWGGISGRQTCGKNQAANGSQKQKSFHHVVNFPARIAQIF